MALFRNISLSFWTDSKVDDHFTPEDKYFYLYLLTNPHTNLCGCYEISMKQMERETGYNQDAVKRILERMEQTHDVIRFCAQTNEILLLNFHKYNWTGSPKSKKAIEREIAQVKNEDFREYLRQLLSLCDQSIPYGYPIDTPSIPHPPVLALALASELASASATAEWRRPGFKSPDNESIGPISADNESIGSYPSTSISVSPSISPSTSIPPSGNTATAEDAPAARAAAVSKNDVNAVAEAWNALGLGQVQKILPGTERGRLLKKRIQDYGLEAVLRAIRNVGESSFLRGGGDKGWVCTFDWLIKPGNFAKVLEGNYADGAAQASGKKFMSAAEYSARSAGPVNTRDLEKAYGGKAWENS